MIGGIQHRMIDADVDSIRSFREHVEFLHRETGYRVRLVRFVIPEDMEEFAMDRPPTAEGAA